MPFDVERHTECQSCLILQGHLVSPSLWNEASWSELELLVEIELDIGGRENLMRALTSLQDFCRRNHAKLNDRIAEIDALGQEVWYKPATWLRGPLQRLIIKVWPQTRPTLCCPLLSQT